MGFWHTGYMEFHEPDGLDGFLTEPLVPEFRCEHCGASFPSFEQLRVHRFEAHPAVRPVLYVRGREVGNSLLRITSRLQPDEIQVLHAVTAELNDQRIDPQDLAQMLSELSSGAASVTLQSDGAHAAFKLHFEIAQPEDLVGVEECFTNTARHRRLDLHAIEDFINCSRRYPSASSYCDGLCDYLYGVLAKERSPCSSIPYREYREKFNRAADTLRDVQRRLAGTVEALVAFHLNHFPLSIARAPGTRVSQASATFLSWIRRIPQPLAGPASTATSVIERLITDRHTELLLGWTAMSCEELVKHTHELDALVDSDIPEFDRVKLRILLSETHASCGDLEVAKHHAKTLWNTPGFEEWAETLLHKSE